MAAARHRAVLATDALHNGGVIQHRACFDFSIAFTNGGTLAATGFRIDLLGPEATRAEVGELLIHDLGLTMVGSIEIANLRIVEEAHRGMRRAAAGAAARRCVELSHAISHGMTTYPGLPGPEITEHLTREAAEAIYGPGVRFQIGRISMVANTGTYLDSPFHRFDDGADLAAVALDRLAALDGVVVRVTGSDRRAVDVAELAPLQRLRPRRADPHRLGAAMAHRGLRRRRAVPHPRRDRVAGRARRGAGRDRLDQRRRRGGQEPPGAHGPAPRGIPIVEHLRALDQLPVTGFAFHAAPPRIERFGTFPVRAYAVIE
jgi:kynurenine formamidase